MPGFGPFLGASLLVGANDLRAFPSARTHPPLRAPRASDHQITGGRSHHWAPTCRRRRRGADHRPPGWCRDRGMWYRGSLTSTPRRCALVSAVTASSSASSYIVIRTELTAERIRSMRLITRVRLLGE